MKRTSSATSRRRQSQAVAKRAKSAPRATTYRLDPRYQRGLALLGHVQKVPVNRLVNEAVGEYLESRTAKVAAELEETLRRVKAYREADPSFEAAIAKFVDAEATLAGEDPVEGKTAAETGPAQRLVRELIRG
jgi:hypothetical protein